jgi:hypothetical protein
VLATGALAVALVQREQYLAVASMNTLLERLVASCSVSCSAHAQVPVDAPTPGPVAVLNEAAKVPTEPS